MGFWKTRRCASNTPRRPTIAGTVHTLSTLLRTDWFESRPPDIEGTYYGPRNRPGIAPKCDLWRGTNTDGASVMLVHGGGFVVGHKRMKAMRLLATHFLGHGAHVCSVDYRMLFRGGDLEAAVDDVAAALSWWADDPMGWGIRAKNIAVVAISAGGALALIATGQSPVPVSRVVSIFGIYDFRSLRGQLAGWLAQQLVGSRDVETLGKASPLRRAQVSAPLLLIHGSEDQLVPVDQAVALNASRRQAGLPTHLSIYEGEPHAFLNFEGVGATRALLELDEFLAPLFPCSEMRDM